MTPRILRDKGTPAVPGISVPWIQLLIVIILGNNRIIDIIIDAQHHSTHLSSDHLATVITDVSRDLLD